MSITHVFQPSPLGRLAPRTQAATRVFVSAVALIVRAVRLRRDAQLLSEMDDYVLRDIGIVRSDIERAVRSGRG